MKPETKDNLEKNRRPNGEFGHHIHTDVVQMVDLTTHVDKSDLPTVSGAEVPAGSVVAEGTFPVRNSSDARPFGGTRVVPGSTEGRTVRLNDDARVLVVGDREAFVKAFFVYPPEWGPDGTVGLDYEAVAADYDAIYVTDMGCDENRAPEDAGMFGDLRGWESAEMIVLRPSALVDA